MGEKVNETFHWQRGDRDGQTKGELSVIQSFLKAFLIAGLNNRNHAFREFPPVLC